jgi:hypothetical protein
VVSVTHPYGRVIFRNIFITSKYLSKRARWSLTSDLFLLYLYHVTFYLVSFTHFLRLYPTLFSSLEGRMKLHFYFSAGTVSNTELPSAKYR